MQYTLSDVSKKFDIPVSTLRYYEKEGGLSFFRRDANGHILIDKADLPTIQLLKLLMDAELPVKTISQIIGDAQKSKISEDPAEISRVYQHIVNLLFDYQDELLRKQQQLLDQMKVSRYLAHEFSRYVKAGTSMLDDEPYSGALPSNFNSNHMGFGISEFCEAFKEKYPYYLSKTT